MKRLGLNYLIRRFDKITALILIELQKKANLRGVKLDLMEFLDWTHLFIESYKVKSYNLPERIEGNLDEFKFRITRIAIEFLSYNGISEEIEIPENRNIFIYTENRYYRYFTRSLNNFIEDVREIGEDETMTESLASPLIYYMVYFLKFNDLSGKERSSLRLRLNEIYKTSVVRMLSQVTGTKYYIKSDRLYKEET